MRSAARPNAPVGGIARAHDIDVEVHADLSGDRAADDEDVSGTPVAAAAAGFGHGQQDGHVLRLAAGHDADRRDLLHGRPSLHRHETALVAFLAAAAHLQLPGIQAYGRHGR